MLSGALAIADGQARFRLELSAAWHGAGACSMIAGSQGVTALRWELAERDQAEPASPAGGARRLLAHPIDLDPTGRYLVRCDRVEFAPGGEARPHHHRGGGIRYLLAGALEVRIGAEPPRRMMPGDAWFESGREPVHAIASPSEPTAFVRVAVLPRETRGQSSIVYVDPADAGVTPRRYTVYVDEPIELAAGAA